MTPENCVLGVKGFQKIPLEDRFWKRVDKSGDCWNWTGATDGRYGQVWNDGKHEKANRTAWRLCVGEIPKGMNVLHKCDNTLCVRPDHLFLGTQKDNLIDAARKNRLALQRVGQDEQRMVVILFNEGFSADQIAKAFGLSIGTVQRALYGKTEISKAALAPDAGADKALTAP